MAGRIQPITIEELVEKGVRHFCWIVPGEELFSKRGDRWVPAPHGAFMYLFHDQPLDSDPKDCFFPISGGRTESQIMHRKFTSTKSFKRKDSVGKQGEQKDDKAKFFIPQNLYIDRIEKTWREDGLPGTSARNLSKDKKNTWAKIFVDDLTKDGVQILSVAFNKDSTCVALGTWIEEFRLICNCFG